MTDKRVLLQDHVETIICGQTRTDRVAEFLRYLPRRGPNAMTTFIAALVQTGQIRLAKLLDEHLTEEVKESVTDRPPKHLWVEVDLSSFGGTSIIIQPGQYSVGVRRVIFKDLDCEPGIVHVVFSERIKPSTSLPHGATPTDIIKSVYVNQGNDLIMEYQNQVEYFAIVLPLEGHDQYRVQLSLIDNQSNHKYFKGSVLLELIPTVQLKLK
jgi:hypothetical protein